MTNKTYILFYFFLATGFEIPKIVCAAALGMENGKIPNSAIVASSRYNQYWGPERGRLNEKKEGKLGFSVLDTFYKWQAKSTFPYGNDIYLSNSAILKNDWKFETREEAGECYSKMRMN